MIGKLAIIEEAIVNGGRRLDAFDPKTAVMACGFT
jgi:hypothetical protein